MSEGFDEVQITSWLAGTRCCVRIAVRIAPPNLPEHPVRAYMSLAKVSRHRFDSYSLESSDVGFSDHEIAKLTS